jgi:hypothetical protein
MHNPGVTIIRCVALFALICVLAGCVKEPDQSGYCCPGAGAPSDDLVQLRAARIPHLGSVAVHCFFAEYDAGSGAWGRWEVWQTAGAASQSWGHVCRDLMSPTSGVGDGPSWVVAEWRGEQARRLRAVLSRPQDYPHTQTYHYWPGPNSNTYAAWVLRQAGIEADLPPGAIGGGWQ